MVANAERVQRHVHLDAVGVRRVDRAQDRYDDGQQRRRARPTRGGATKRVWSRREHLLLDDAPRAVDLVARRDGWFVIGHLVVRGARRRVAVGARGALASVGREGRLEVSLRVGVVRGDRGWGSGRGEGIPRGFRVGARAGGASRLGMSAPNGGGSEEVGREGVGERVADDGAGDAALAARGGGVPSRLVEGSRRAGGGEGIQGHRRARVDPPQPWSVSHHPLTNVFFVA